MSDQAPCTLATWELIKCQKAFNELQDKVDQSFWEGFDACLMMVLNSLDNLDSNDIAKFSTWEFIEDYREHIIYEAELYKQDG